MSRLIQLTALTVEVALLAACASDVAPPSPSSTASATSSATGVPSGTSEPFRLYTHCGLGWASIEFDGDIWQATGVGPLDDGAGNPPPGFGNPFDEGHITRLDGEHAIYESSQGVLLNFERVDEPFGESCF